MAIGYVGTYTQGKSKGIYRFEFNESTGLLSKPSLFYTVQNPRYLAYNNKTLFAVCEMGKKAGVIALDKNGSLIDSYMFEDSGSCYLTVHKKKLYAANFHEGMVSVLEYTQNKLKLLKKTLIQEGAGAHQILFYKNKFLVPCRNIDKIIVLDSNFEICDRINFLAHSGPRHGALSSNNKKLYVVGELSNEFFLLNIIEIKGKKTQFKHMWKQTLLYEGADKIEGTAAIRLSKNGRTIWTSTRGANCISVVSLKENDSLENLTVHSCEGEHPRDILPVCNEKFLLVANKDTNNIVSFSIQGNELKKINEINIPEGISIVMEES